MNLNFWSFPIIIFIAGVLTPTSLLSAQEPVPAMSATVLVGEIDLDGRLDEMAWQHASPGSNYIQGKPYEGKKALEETEVRVLIGEKFIYVGAQMYESDPSVVDKNLMRRDAEGQYDFINVAFDSNFDRRTGYYFRVSAANVQFDKYFYNDSEQDQAWNAVWESAVHHHDRGWSVEMKIPLSQIRYDSSEPNQTWGFQSSRRRMVENEWSYFELMKEKQKLEDNMLYSRDVEVIVDTNPVKKINLIVQNALKFIGYLVLGIFSGVFVGILVFIYKKATSLLIKTNR